MTGVTEADSFGLPLFDRPLPDFPENPEPNKIADID